MNKYALVTGASRGIGKNIAQALAKEGYQALDIGHFDIEYEWYLRGASVKEKIENKYTNEVKGGNLIVDINNEKYNEQIKKIIK